MAQNNMMGGGMVPPPASPANPTALNFQSDPNMRQQFKGFMSGLSNRPMPQPMAQPMPSPMPMYTPASNIDIFEPVQGFANGGGVSFSSGSDYSPGEGVSISSSTVQGDDTYGGRNDRRDSSGLNDPYEAEMIQTGKSFLDSFSPFSGGDSDGPVAFGIGSRPSVNLSARSMPQGGDALSNEIGRLSNQTGYDDAPMTSRGMLTNQAQADAAMGRGFGASGTTQSVTGAPTARDGSYDDFGLGALNLLGNVDLLDPDAVNRQKFDSIARSMQDAYGQVAVNPELTRLRGGAAVVSGRPIQTPDEIAYNDTMMQTDIAPADVEAIATNIARDKEAQRLAMGGGQVNVDPVTGEVSSIPVPASRPSTLIDYDDPTQISRSVDIASPLPRPSTLIDSGRDLSMASPYDLGEAAGQQVAQGQPSGTAPIERERTEAGRTNRIADSGFGPGEIYDAAGSRQPADRQGFFTTLLDTMTGREFPTDAEIDAGIDKAFDAQTTALLSGDKKKMAPKLGTQGAATRSALEQLAERATPSDRGGIFGAITNFGANNAANMYNDIVNRGYEPVYDSRGQIVATKVPGTDILGRGSVEGRIPGRDNTGGGGDAPLPVQAPQPSVADLVAAELAKLQPAQPAPTQTTPTPVSPTPTTSTPQAPTPLARPLGFGYGQIQGINPNLDNAANKFLSLLGGFAEGGEVKKFEKGGSVPRSTEIAGQPHMLSYITPGEASVLQSLGGSGAPGPGGIPSFFYDEVGAVADTTGNIGSGGQDQDFSGSDDDNDDYVAPTVAPDTFIDQDGTKISTDVANQMNQRAKADAEARAALESANLQQQQVQTQAPQQQQSIRDRISSVASSSKPSFSDMLGDLFSFDAPDTMSDLERTQLEVRGRMADRGSSYYGQNLPQMGQDLAQAGMAPANTQYMDVLSSGTQGGSRYGGNMQDIGARYQSPQQVAAGIQQGVQGAFDVLGQQFGGSGAAPFQSR